MANWRSLEKFGWAPSQLPVPLPSPWLWYVSEAVGECSALSTRPYSLFSYPGVVMWNQANKYLLSLRPNPGAGKHIRNNSSPGLTWAASSSESAPGLRAEFELVKKDLSTASGYIQLINNLLKSNKEIAEVNITYGASSRRLEPVSAPGGTVAKGKSGKSRRTLRSCILSVDTCGISPAPEPRPALPKGPAQVGPVPRTYLSTSRAWQL